jgi:hypothetical protein
MSVLTVDLQGARALHAGAVSELEALRAASARLHHALLEVGRVGRVVVLYSGSVECTDKQGMHQGSTCLRFQGAIDNSDATSHMHL